MVHTVTTQIHDQDFILHPSGAMYWKHQDMVLIADVHLGKITHFRKHGSAVPQQAIQKNFEQLNAVVHYFNPKRICFLGDLFHSHINSEWDAFAHWMSNITAEVILVLGNHDIMDAQQYTTLGIQLKKSWYIQSIALTHHPTESKDQFNIAGHIHPGVHLQGRGKQYVNVSCFFKSKTQMILPAFGVFTGNYILQPTTADQIFAIAADEVIPIQHSCP